MRSLHPQVGLSGRAIAYAGEHVSLTGPRGGASSETFHRLPDAAACFANPSSGGHFYSSNSEREGKAGGVGVIEFDASGEVIGYFRTLTGTSMNCGGGKTPW